MRVVMKTNLGLVHAQMIGVDQSKCMAGMTPTVSHEAGEWLVRRGMADPVIEPPAAPVVQAVPSRPAISDTIRPQIAGETKTSEPRPADNETEEPRAPLANHGRHQRRNR